MWLLIAIMCSGELANTCTTMVWQEKSFLTQESCLERAVLADTMIPSNVKYYSTRCVEIPSQVNT